MNLRSVKRRLYKWLYPVYQTAGDYVAIIGFMLFVSLWTFALYLLLPVFAFLFKGIFGEDLSMSDFILLITAGFLMATLYETRKTNIQNREKDLRPIILRLGFITAWNDIKFTFSLENRLLEKPLEFKVIDNIATNISGSIRINGKRYKLIFSHDVTREGEKIRFIESWTGWIERNNFISAIFLLDSESDTDLEDGIMITYDDMEGNHYVTIEDSNFVQKSFKA